MVTRQQINEARLRGASATEREEEALFGTEPSGAPAASMPAESAHVANLFTQPYGAGLTPAVLPTPTLDIRTGTAPPAVNTANQAVQRAATDAHRRLVSVGRGGRGRGNGRGGGIGRGHQGRDYVSEEEEQALHCLTQQMEARKANSLAVGIENGASVGASVVLPPGFRYPKMTLQQMVSIWLIGNRAGGVPPLQYLQPKDVSKWDKKARNLNRMKQCMEVIKKVAVRKGCWKPLTEPSTWWNGHKVSVLWNAVVGDIVPHLKTGRVTCVKSKSLVLVCSWRTNADDIVKARRVIA